MAKTSTQPNLIDGPPAPLPTAAEIMKPLGWRREQRSGGVTAWRKDDPCGDYFLIHGGNTTDADPAAKIWTGGRYFDVHAPEGATPFKRETEVPASLATMIATVTSFERLAPLPVFTPIEALRNLVLFHDGDSDFLAANRSLIADMPFGETSFEEALWQTARDVVTSSTRKPEEKK